MIQVNKNSLHVGNGNINVTYFNYSNWFCSCFIGCGVANLVHTGLLIKGVGRKISRGVNGKNKTEK